MAALKVTYARLYNLGNYENERLEVEVAVQDNGPLALEAAWDEACAAVEDHHARLVAAREEALQRQQEEYEQRRAAAMTRKAIIPAQGDDPIF